MEKLYAVTIHEMGETIRVSARNPQAAYDKAQTEARASFTPPPEFDELTIGVKEAKAPKHTPEPWALHESSQSGTYITGTMQGTGGQPKEVYIATVEPARAHARHQYLAPGCDAVGNAAVLVDAAAMLRTLKDIRAMAYNATVSKAPAAILRIVEMAEAAIGEK